jgi:hypothetical protein
MATLEAQYQSYLKENPDSTYTFDEWKENVFHPRLESFVRYSYDFDKEELKDWDVTLMDGLDDSPNYEN